MLRSLKGLWVVDRGLWGVVLLACLAAPAWGAIWPEQIGEFKRASAAALTVTDRPLWDEYGFDQAERATYEAGGKKFVATAWRLKDSTGAFAAFQWQRLAGAQPSKLSELAVETGEDALIGYGNYLLHFAGWKPQVTDLASLIDRLPKLEKSPLPTLTGYLPARDLVANSERYILGPASLERFRPGIPPSAVALHMGAEGQIARFRPSGQEMDLLIVSYPTPHIARDQLAALQKVPGVMAKRAGPLVALIVSPADPDAAERLLALVRYQADVTLTEYVPTRRDNIGDLILNIFLLTGVLLLFCAVAGLAYGGILAGMRRWRSGPGSDDPMILLHLEDRSAASRPLASDR